MHVGTHEMWLNNRFECYVVFKGYSGAARHATTFSTTSIFYDNSDVRKASSFRHVVSTISLRARRRELDIPKFKIRLYNGEGARGYEFPTSNTLGTMVFKSGITSNTNVDVIIQHKDGPPQRVNKLHPSYMARRITMLAYYIYQLHFCLQQYDLLFRGDKLFQQYVVGVFYAVEQNRLDFLRKKQNDIRVDYLSGLMMLFLEENAMVTKKMGNPQFFITFTCNVNWPEIKRFMAQYPELTASDRADVVCRVFEQKIQSFVTFLKEERIFGNVTGAELPDPRIDPDGYNIVSETMMHGPYGAANMKASCMKGDNYVVPYNRDLLLALRAHINVEYCGWSMLIKYLFKYISKGIDIIFARVFRPMGESSTEAAPSREMVDEIQNYVEGHFICAHEAYWRIFKFDIHHRELAVQMLETQFHSLTREARS
ncbi:DNA helicase [Tanacetum coccineum]